MEPETPHAVDGTNDSAPEERGVMPLAIAAGGCAALVGGVAWALIVIATQYAIGFMATGVGLLAGFGVHLSAWKKRETLSGRDLVRLQAIAVVSAIGGLLVGKYLIFAWEHGGFGPDVSQLKMVPYFFETLAETVTPFDAIWSALAVYAAWKITALRELDRRRLTSSS